MTGFGGVPDTFRPLGLQHERAMILPFAAGCVEESRSQTNVNCSMDFSAPSADFGGLGWRRWAEGRCAADEGGGLAPCVSLEEVIDGWLRGRCIRVMKLVSKPLRALLSVGAAAARIEEVHLQPPVEAIGQLRRLGFSYAGGKASPQAICTTAGSSRSLIFQRAGAGVKCSRGSSPFLDGAPAAPRRALVAPLQLAPWPLAQSWRHLGEEAPSAFVLEVGANNRNLFRRDLWRKQYKRRFLVTFEPLLDKYAALLADYDSAVPSTSMWAPLQHAKGIALPYAVSCPGETASFNVAPVDGCSSLLNMSEAFDGRGWRPWVKERCSKLQERRLVPCISLEVVVRDWLRGYPVTELRIDAQGADLDVVRSLGSQVGRVGKVFMEAQTGSGSRLYEGQPLCPEVVEEMARLGFRLRGRGSGRAGAQVCNSSRPELNLEFERSDRLSPEES